VSVISRLGIPADLYKMAERISLRCRKSTRQLELLQSADNQVYALIHVAQIWRSDHSGMRKLALMVESVYNALNLLFTWFALANFYIFFVSQLVHSSANQDR
jgi:hypothetical protein